MRLLLFTWVCLIFVMSAPVWAQDDSDVSVSDDLAVPVSEMVVTPPEPVTSAADGEVISEPACFNIVNKAPYGVFGTFITNYYTADDGSRARHRSNFRLKTKEKAEFCTYGPFYDGQRLELVLRTLVPVFSCKTKIDEEIMIYGRRKAEGGTDTWAVCK